MRLTNDSFAECVREHRFVVIHFWAAWNGVDRLMQRLLESQVSDEFHKHVMFASFDIDPAEHRELCILHSVPNVPFLAFYRDGSLVRTVTGMTTPEAINGYLSELVYGATS